MSTEIDELKRAGEYEKAADLAEANGRLQEAAQLHAEIWNYDRAIELAERGGFLVDAYQHAIAGNQREAIERLLAQVMGLEELALKAADVAFGRGRSVDAARLFESVAELERAADLYEQAGSLFDAARVRESQGKYRVAGRLYERRVRAAPEDAEAALRLGRILLRFGRHEHAVRALQKAEADPTKRIECLRLMIVCFHTLGLHDAAGHRLHDLRALEPTVPLTVEAFLQDAAFQNHAGDGSGAEQGAESEQYLALRYKVLRPLGAGATGRVILAHDAFYDREVAVKVLTVGAGGVGRDAYTRFAREARVAAGLSHPNVVPVYEFNPDGPFLVMEYMQGGTLEERIEAEADGRLPAPVIHHVLTSILKGLSVVHRRGVVHRDLKPANVFFSESGEVKIGDFGVAHLTDLGATLTGALMGTLAYMSPEQVTGSKRPAAGTDMYALGVIFFRMLTGRLPFPGPDFVLQHLESPIPKLADVAPEYAHLDPLLERLLAKDLEDRIDMADAVRAELDRHPWEETGRTATEVAMGVPKRKSTVPPPAEDEGRASRTEIRYPVLETLEDGSTLCRDEVLLRRVRIEPCEPARLDRLKALAKADHVSIQAVYEVDSEAGRAVLESPAGTLLPKAELSLSERDHALSEIREALTFLHGRNLVHGEVRADMIRVGTGRAVLLLPRQPPSGATAGDDDRAFRKVAAQLPNPPSAH